MFVWRRKRYRVTQGDGPERLHGEWWRDGGIEGETPFSVRDYYQVETEGGGRYWLFRLGDGVHSSTGSLRCFLHGAFASECEGTGEHLRDQGRARLCRTAGSPASHLPERSLLTLQLFPVFRTALPT